jgi:hypothetical protein
MNETIIDASGNISTPEGDSYTLEINLTRESGGFLPEDKVLVEIRDGNTLGTVFSRLVGIEGGVARMKMGALEAQAIPPGDYVWSYSVYLNARKLPSGEMAGDEKVTPFRTAGKDAWRRYHVEGGTDGRNNNNN